MAAGMQQPTIASTAITTATAAGTISTQYSYREACAFSGTLSLSLSLSSLSLFGPGNRACNIPRAFELVKSAAAFLSLLFSRAWPKGVYYTHRIARCAGCTNKVLLPLVDKSPISCVVLVSFYFLKFYCVRKLRAGPGKSMSAICSLGRRTDF